MLKIKPYGFTAASVPMLLPLQVHVTIQNLLGHQLISSYSSLTQFYSLLRLYVRISLENSNAMILSFYTQKTIKKLLIFLEKYLFEVKQNPITVFVPLL